jgi:hypothetical protein
LGRTLLSGFRHVHGWQPRRNRCSPPADGHDFQGRRQGTSIILGVMIMHS